MSGQSLLGNPADAPKRSDKVEIDLYPAKRAVAKGKSPMKKKVEAKKWTWPRKNKLSKPFWGKTTKQSNWNPKRPMNTTKTGVKQRKRGRGFRLQEETDGNGRKTQGPRGGGGEKKKKGGYWGCDPNNGSGQASTETPE